MRQVLQTADVQETLSQRLWAQPHFRTGAETDALLRAALEPRRGGADQPQQRVVHDRPGERIGVLVDKAPNAAGKELSWDTVNETFVFYATRLKSRMLAK